MILVLELAAAPFVSWRTRQALAGCGVEHASLELGARPHVWSIVAGRLVDVHMEIEGYRLGPVRIDRVDLAAERVDFPRRSLVGISSPLTLTNATATATISADALDAAMSLPFTSIRVTAAGIFVVVLGATVEVLLAVEDGRLELRLVNESLPALRLDPPAGAEIIDVTTTTGRVLVTARLPDSMEPGPAC